MFPDSACRFFITNNQKFKGEKANVLQMVMYLSKSRIMDIVRELTEKQFNTDIMKNDIPLRILKGTLQEKSLDKLFRGKNSRELLVPGASYVEVCKVNFHSWICKTNFRQYVQQTGI